SGVETRLGARAPSLERRIHGHAHHSGPDDEIAVRLKARSQRPFDLMMVVNIDVVVEDIEMLERPYRLKQGCYGFARLPFAALPNRNAQRIHAAGDGQQIDRNRFTNDLS